MKTNKLFQISNSKYNRTYIVAYIDILGFSNKVIASFSNNEYSSFVEIERVINKSIRKYKSNFRYVNKTINELRSRNNHINIKDVNIKYFSDTIIMTLEIDKNLVNTPNFKISSILDVIQVKIELLYLSVFFGMVQDIYIDFLSKGILIRGGVTIDKHYEDKRFIFSNALLKAYKIETEISNYPRIIIDKQLVNIILGMNDQLPINEKVISFNNMLVDIFGYNFITPVKYDRFITKTESKELKLLEDIKLENNRTYSSKDIKLNIRNLSKTLDLLISEFNGYDTITIDSKIRIKHLWIIDLLKWNITYLKNILNNKESINYESYKFFEPEMNV